MRSFKPMFQLAALTVAGVAGVLLVGLRGVEDPPTRAAVGEQADGRVTAQPAERLVPERLIPEPGRPHLTPSIPSDPQQTCTVSAATLASWFQSGAVSLDGVATPANSVTFPNTPNCSFYQWAERMFLWVTSPAPTIYGAGSRVFDSNVFFDVSPPDATGARTFLAHRPGLIRNLALRVAQAGPHGLPVIFDKAGRMLEVERPTQPNAKARVLTTSKSLVEVERAEVSAEGKTVLFDKAGKVIQMAAPPRLAPTANRTAPIRVQKILVHGFPIFIDPSGNVLEVEQGQADDSVLESQNQSLVYYSTMVNDVYAYFLTGAKDGAITPATQFPVSATDLSKITAFAAAHSVTFPDPNALAVELKTSWVDASTVSNPSAYFTAQGIVPTYDTSSSTTWTPSGTKQITLALVGVHVVGSAAGHPEMIWATFEHQSNTPAGTYAYVNSSGTTTTVAQSTTGTWLFTANAAPAPFNFVHMQWSSPNIVAVSPNTISPSNTIRWKAFGAAANTSPNPLDASAAASNTEILAIDNSILEGLASGDLRRNYYMTGATWTIGGASPSGIFPSGNEVGTSFLANTTMETYQQGTDNTSASGANCFSCHATNTTTVSHVYPFIKPLF